MTIMEEFGEIQKRTEELQKLINGDWKDQLGTKEEFEKKDMSETGYEEETKREMAEIEKDYKAIIEDKELSPCCGAPLDISKSRCSACKENV